MENTTSLIDCIVVYHDSLGKLTTANLRPNTNCSNCSTRNNLSGAVFCGHYSWSFWGFVKHSLEIPSNFSRETLPDSCDKHHPELPCEGHRCSIGKCLKHESVCNGEVDCPDGSDEWAENCSPRENTSCPITELKCANGKCIPKQLFCNHVDDCGDLSDEPDECSCLEYFRWDGVTENWLKWKDFIENFNETSKMIKIIGLISISRADWQIRKKSAMVSLIATIRMMRIINFANVAGRNSSVAGINYSSFYHYAFFPLPFDAFSSVLFIYNAPKSSSSNFCVPREMVCDGMRDCPDGEDEEHCTGIRYPLYNR